MGPFCPTPMLEAGIEPFACARCGVKVSPDNIEEGDDLEVYFNEADDMYYCPACGEQVDADLDADVSVVADQFAREHCQILGTPLEYDPSLVGTTTPDGKHYSRAYVDAFNRHECTNYEYVLADIPRNLPFSVQNAYYSAIRERIEELIEDARYGIEEEAVD